MNLRFPLIAVAGACVCLAAGAYFFTHGEAQAAQQDTDDAYVQADLVRVAPQVGGLVTRVHVDDNQRVAAGDPLFDIDERDLRIALAQAQARVATAQASIARVQAQLARQGSALSQARATVDADQAALTLAGQNRERYTHLAADGSGTVQAQQQADAQWRTQQAGLVRDQAAVTAVDQQSAILQAELAQARAALQAAQADEARVTLDLSRTHVTAPVAGVVSQRQVRQGQLAQAGQALLTVVPVQALYVEANFRETQWARLRVGQPVSLTVDALPGQTLRGQVASLGPASGVSLAGVPAHNATGNFTKIVQRLPVRIAVQADEATLARLRVGMSVHPVIQTAQP